MNVPDALNHPVRRQILRILIDSGEPRDSGEIIAAGLPDLSVSAVGYHVRVLESAGMISRDGGATGDESTYRFAATAVDDPEIVAMLESTRDTDVADG
ncbi:MAG: Helix-turn-helix domain [Solirubrobacterales bacterium]|nr:Helix-turn-helix domain [Solirubrobacterales bacterium]